MNERIVSDDPKVFSYLEPVGKMTSLLTLIAFLFAVGAGIGIIVNLVTQGSTMSFAIIIFILSVVAIFAVPGVAAKRTMDVRSEFSAWSVTNYGLTPLEFLNPKFSSYKADTGLMKEKSRITDQKFLNSDTETVIATVNEDHSETENEGTGYVRITISNIRPDEESTES
jgi:hypothetical protein